MDKLHDKALENKYIYIQCTYANAYATTYRNPGQCIQSYDRAVLSDLFSKLKTILKKKLNNRILGESTGNYFIDSSGRKWIEVILIYSTRLPYGWMMEHDIWYQGKETEPNPADWSAIGYNATTGKGNDTAISSKSTGSFIKLVLGGLTLLSFLK